MSEITGHHLILQSKRSLGDDYYYGANVDLDDPNWPGPWDCAEKVTYDVRWVTGKVYGCLDNADKVDPEPYTGGWRRDVKTGVVIGISPAKAAKIEGAILLRFRPGGKHIVFSCGNGATIEAKNEHYGVCQGKVGNITSWDYGILIPGVIYKGV